MKNYMKIAKISLVIVLFFGAIFSKAENHESHGHGEAEEFNATEMINHHISDAHDFHIIGDVSLALPVILWVDGELITFSSSQFKHTDDGSQLVEVKGKSFAKVHEKIYLMEEGQSVIAFDEEHHPTNAHKVLLDFSITKNVFSMLMSAVFILLIFFSVARTYKKRGTAAPRGFQNFIETLIVFVRDEIALPNIGQKKLDRFLPYLLTLFFFIWINNLIGLIPFFPFSANLTGNIAFTVTLALCTLFVTNLNGNKHYWGHILWMPGVPLPLKPVMAVLELVGVFSKPFALTIRLFANITAGHIIILALYSIIFSKGAGWFGLSGPIALFMNVLELLVAFLQAYVFTLLTALFIGQAVEEHEHH